MQGKQHDEQLYSTVLKYIKEGVYFVDTERRISFWNYWAEHITGFSSSKVLGSFCHDNLLNHVDEEGIPLCKNGCPLQRTLDDGLIREARVFLHHKDGHRHPVTVRVYPLIEGADIIGALELFTDDLPYFELYQHVEKLKVIAMTDQLTELANRRYTELYINSKLAQLDSLHVPFSVAFIDIDHFKQVNDTYGHEVGDEVLRQVGNTLKGADQSIELIGRWGGEEFLAVLSSSGREEISSAAERLRMVIECSQFLRGTADIKLTVSVGAYAVKKMMTTHEVIHHADSLMYTSKHRGRNCVTVG